MHLAAKASVRRGRVSSNVRPHNSHHCSPRAKKCKSLAANFFCQPRWRHSSRRVLPTCEAIGLCRYLKWQGNKASAPPRTPPFRAEKSTTSRPYQAAKVAIRRRSIAFIRPRHLRSRSSRTQYSSWCSQDNSTSNRRFRSFYLAGTGTITACWLAAQAIQVTPSRQKRSREFRFPRC